MNILPKHSENVYPKVLPVDKHMGATDLVKSAFDKPESISDRKGDLKQCATEVNVPSGARVHYLSRTIAREHGIEVAAVLAGFARKLKKHKSNYIDGLFWFYDPIETLVQMRWPYFSVGGLHGVIRELVNAKLLLKGSKNKKRYDRTGWYAMNPESIEAALHDKIGFDVRIASDHEGRANIRPAIIYHNLRYFLLKEREKNPSEVPYHKLCLSQLARDLPMDRSSVKRAINYLHKKGEITRHPVKKGWWTIPGVCDSTIGSIVNGIKSVANGSVSESNGSVANLNGSIVKVNGSFVNDYTQYKTNKNTNTNQSEICTGVEEENVIILSNCSIVEQRQELGSSIAAIEENSAGALSVANLNSFEKHYELHNLEHLRSHTKKLSSLIQPTKELFGDDYLMELCDAFLEEKIDFFAVRDIVNRNSQDDIVKRLSKPFWDFIQFAIPEHEVVSRDDLVLAMYYPGLELVVGALSCHDKNIEQYDLTFPDDLEKLYPLTEKCLSILQKEKGIAAEEKAKIFVNGIRWWNQNGFPIEGYSDRFAFKLKIPKAIEAKAIEYFKGNKVVSSWELLILLYECIDITMVEEAPKEGEFDLWFYCRRGANNLYFFLKHQKRISKEIDSYNQSLAD
jgi:hypothetical protein